MAAAARMVEDGALVSDARIMPCPARGRLAAPTRRSGMGVGPQRRRV
ncbi:MAG TPA: hypothetical protein VF229_02260 [Burkholderiaceae bacterium]